MEEIKVNEYVRTNLGHIGKIIKEYTFKNGEVVYPEPQEWVLDNKYVLNEAGMYQMGEQIVKHSPNIIDLIEEDDIGIMRYNGLIFKKFITKDDILELKFKNYELLEIVTKEIFNQVKYEV
jgi:hypothetical protein